MPDWACCLRTGKSFEIIDKNLILLMASCFSATPSMPSCAALIEELLDRPISRSCSILKVGTLLAFLAITVGVS